MTWITERLSDSITSLEFADGRHETLETLLATEPNSEWEKLSQPIALEMETSLLRANLMTKIKTHRQVLTLAIGHYLIKIFSSMAHTNHEDLLRRFQSSQYMIIRVSNLAGLVVSATNNSSIRIGLVTDLLDWTRFYDGENMRLCLI